MTSTDVVVVGYGPAGQALSALLARRGHRVVAFERYPGLYGMARAGHIDHEVLRTVQSLSPAGAEALESTMHPALEEYVWLNGEGEVILHQPHVEPGARSVSGWWRDYTLWQPELEDVLVEAGRSAGVEAHLSWEVVGLEEREDHVVVTASRVAYNEAGERELTEDYRVLTARYVVGADGASSIVRRSRAIPREDDGVDELWLVCDMRTLDPTHRIVPFMAQICDPARPRLVMPLGPRHRRFEWRVMPGEDPKEMARPETAWQLLTEFGVTPRTHEIARQVVYRFQARTARSWRDGRFFLIGDAAHTMPPYAGQGLCGAVRDATNLAWKLDLVMRGAAGDRLLDTYEEERRAHHRTWTELSIAEGRISNVLDAEEARERDRRLLEEGLEIPPVPGLVSGLLDAGSADAGSLALQAPVRTGSGAEGLLESVLPGAMTRLVLASPEAASELGPTERDTLQRLGAEVVVLGDDVEDSTGSYGEWFAGRGAVAMLYRPDFYVFGTAARGEVAGLVTRFHERVTR